MSYNAQALTLSLLLVKFMMMMWFNFGLIDKAPIFDQVIRLGCKNASDPKNEKFTAFEFGLNARSNDGTAGKLNVYNAA